MRDRDTIQHKLSSEFEAWARLHEAQASDYVVVTRERYVELLRLFAELARVVEERRVVKRRRRAPVFTPPQGWKE